MAKRKIIDVSIEVEHITNWIKNYFIKNGPNSKAIIGISGGKDSTVAAALLCRALGKDRVVGVIMPDGTMSDFTIAKDVCGYLGINSIVVDIGSITSALYRAIDDGYDDDHCIKNNPAVSTNTPARIRMSVLYALAAEMHGRVVNTCNKSEVIFISFTTHSIGWNFMNKSIWQAEICSNFLNLSYTIRRKNRKISCEIAIFSTITNIILGFITSIYNSTMHICRQSIKNGHSNTCRRIS